MLHAQDFDYVTLVHASIINPLDNTPHESKEIPHETLISSKSR